MRPIVSAFLSIFLLISTNLAAKEKADLVVSGGIVITMDSSRRVLDDGAVAVLGNKILDVGPSTDIAKRFEAKRAISAKGRMIIPGLINAHNHAPMTLLRGIADDLKLDVWLEKHIFPLEAKNANKDFVEWGTALACLEMIKSGTTTYADMYYFEDTVAEVTARAGMRGLLGETILQYPSPDSKTTADALALAETFIKRWKSHSLITPVIAPHAPYTNTPESLKASKALADKYDIPLFIHVAETEKEEKEMREKHGMSSTQWLESLGILGPKTVFDHGVWLSPQDIALVKKYGVSVAHNPESNMKLASGVAPVPALLANGIAVGLGTDGPASNNNLDMFESMDFAAKLHKVTSMDPTVLPAVQVLEMATILGAKSLGMEKEIGSLEKGKRADFILIDATAPHLLPLYNPYSQIVYDAKGSDVRTSIIDGKVVMLERKVLTLNESLILKKAQEFQKKIAATQ